MPPGEGLGNDNRDLPDRTYVWLTEAITWIVEGVCLNDDACDQRRNERAKQSRKAWWSEDGPAWLKPHLELLAKGESWAFAPDASQDNAGHTLRVFRTAEKWLAETGQDAAAAHARVCTELSERESAERDLQRRLDRLYTHLFNACADQRIVLLGLLRTEDKREHIEYSTIPWEYFLRPVMHTIGTGYYGKGELSPALDDTEAFASIFSRDGDRRATYREVQIRREDALKLKTAFEASNPAPGLSDAADPVPIVISRCDAERECERWLASLMGESPDVRRRTNASLISEAMQTWVGRLSKEGFHRAKAAAISATGATAWAKAGASRKSPGQKSRS